MSEIQRAIEIAHNLDDLSQKEFGAKITMPSSKKVIIPPHEQQLLTRAHPNIPDAKLVSIAKNFRRLTTMPGSLFGLLKVVDKEIKIFPGVITTRTTPSEIHFTYLNDAISPVNLKHGLTPLQHTMLSGGLGIQDKAVGTSHSHDNVAKTATEVGHTAMAVRALTDGVTMNAITNGEHIAHDWGKSKAGIAPHLTTRTEDTPGMFDLYAAGNPRLIDFKSVALTPESNAMLVTASSFEQPDEPDAEIDNTKIVLGVGLLAAQQLYGNNTQDKMLRAMEQI